MSPSTANPRQDGERAAGMQRLKGAMAERKQARDRRETAKGTDGEVEAAASVRAADDHVLARQRWLDWVGDRDQE